MLFSFKLIALALASGLVAAQNATVTVENCVPTVIGTHTVVSGDSLWQIATNAGVTLAAIELVNPQITNPDFIQVGDIVNIPSCSPIEAPAPPAPTPGTCVVDGAATYTIVGGDTLFAIARDLNITLGALVDANPQIEDINLIVVGQVINVPVCAKKTVRSFRNRL